MVVEKPIKLIPAAQFVRAVIDRDLRRWGEPANVYVPTWLNRAVLFCLDYVRHGAPSRGRQSDVCARFSAHLRGSNPAHMSRSITWIRRAAATPTSAEQTIRRQRRVESIHFALLVLLEPGRSRSFLRQTLSVEIAVHNQQASTHRG